MAHYISYSLFDGHCYLDNRSNSRANTCIKPQLLEGVYLLDGNQCGATRIMVIHNNFRIDRMIDASFKFLPYQLYGLYMGWSEEGGLDNGNSWGMEGGKGREKGGKKEGNLEEEFWRKSMGKRVILEFQEKSEVSDLDVLSKRWDSRKEGKGRKKRGKRAIEIQRKWRGNPRMSFGGIPLHFQGFGHSHFGAKYCESLTVNLAFPDPR